MREVALLVHLRLFAVGRRRKRHDAKHARADALGDGANRPSLSRAVAAFKDDDDAQALVLDPFLELAQLCLETAQLLHVRLVAQFPVVLR
jgi:hypothetical protein